MMLKDNNSSAIKVHNVTFGYDNQNVILDNCNINVARGTIYALLGPSGCGKTTLLRCLLNRLTPYNGTIEIFGESINSRLIKIPGSGVGYMPQELALSPELTVNETLIYYGQLHCMTKAIISERIKYFVNLFDLQDRHRKVSNLSGGQKRRVSLSVALIHQPPLLILDEPTVGVDPILRQNIWHYLTTICNYGNKNLTTVVITTHYIEEARNATTVGLMRSGKMLEEANPDSLMSEYQCKALEDVFLALCEKQDNGIKQNNVLQNHVKQQRKTSLINNYKNERLKRYLRFNLPFAISLSHILVLLKSNWKKLTRNWFITLYYLIFPSIQMVLYYYTFGGIPRHVSLAVVNEEVIISRDDNNYAFGNQLLSSLPKDIIAQYNHRTLSSAITAVKNGTAWAVIHLKANYSQSLKQRFKNVHMDNNDTIYSSNIHLYLDNTNPIISLAFYHYLIKSFEDVLKTMFNIDRVNNDQVFSSIPYQLENTYGDISDGPSMTQYSSPGMLLSAVFYMAMIMSGHSVMNDRTDGFLERNLVSGVGIVEIIITHLITQMSLGAILVPLVMFSTYTIFQLPFEGSMIEGSLLLFLQVTTGITLGFLLATICTSTYQLTLMSVAIMMPISFTCGIFWPVEAMPKYAQHFAYRVPMTLALDAFRSISIRGWTIWSSWSVMIGFLSSGAISVIFLFASIAIFKWITSP